MNTRSGSIAAALVMVALSVACNTTPASDQPAAQLSDPAPASPAPSASSPPSATAGSSTAPVPDELPDGIVAQVADVGGSRLFIVWDGTAERIQQPAPMDRATVREIGLRRAAPVERFTARAQPDPRTFWVVVPPSGPRARLHLAVRNRLHPVITVPAEQAQIDRLGVPADPLLNLMRPAR